VDLAQYHRKKNDTYQKALEVLRLSTESALGGGGGSQLRSFETMLLLFAEMQAHLPAHMIRSPLRERTQMRIQSFVHKFD
jgi:glutamine amidotransferase PdxT